VVRLSTWNMFRWILQVQRGPYSFLSQPSFSLSYCFFWLPPISARLPDSRYSRLSVPFLKSCLAHVKRTKSHIPIQSLGAYQVAPNFVLSNVGGTISSKFSIKSEAPLPKALCGDHLNGVRNKFIMQYVDTDSS
jgi:hypothetical protein